MLSWIIFNNLMLLSSLLNMLAFIENAQRTKYWSTGIMEYIPLLYGLGERFGDIIESRLFRPIFFFFFLCSALFNKQAINHSVVWLWRHWKRSTYKLLFPLGQAYVLRWIDAWIDIITSLFDGRIVKDEGKKSQPLRFAKSCFITSWCRFEFDESFSPTVLNV